MINWIIGCIIVFATLYVIVNAILKMKKGKSGCDCGSCDYKDYGCSKKIN